jgi:hypothetical protein
MTPPGWDEDDRLLEELRRAVARAGKPTPTMIAAGYAAYSWATVDAELAALTHDSMTEQPTLVRGAPSEGRALVFEGAQQSVELEQNADGLVGQLVPPGTGQVTLLGPDGELAHADVDEMGCFTFERPVTGLVRLRCRTSAGALLTDWVRL